MDLNDLDRRMKGAISVLKTELGGLRTGRASVNLLEPIHVEVYGASMPLNQVATISVPESRMLSVQVWDKSNAQAVERAVALTPTHHKRGQALKAALEARQSQPALTFAEQPTEAVHKPAPPPVPEAPKLRQVVLLMTSEQYAIYEQAKRMVEARQGKRVSKETAVTEMSRALLASADNRSKVRHQVIVHVNGETGQGFYDTDRGLLPAEPAAVDEAMKQTGIVVTGAPSVLPAGSTQTEQLPLLPSRSKGRPAIPVGLVRAVYARACGRCERCSCTGGNLVIHHVRAWSDTRRHRLEDLELLCPGCHANEHVKDYESRPEWQAARDAGVRRRPTRSRSG